MKPTLESFPSELAFDRLKSAIETAAAAYNLGIDYGIDYGFLVDCID